MNEILIFEIASLADRVTGAREIYSFTGPVEIDGIAIKGDVTGRLEMMRVEDGFNVKVMDIQISVEMICCQCLKKFTFKIKLPPTERVFWIDQPSKVEDLNDLFLIDRKNMKIDISEMLRQEIILHLPINPVCSKSCKGMDRKYFTDSEVKDYKPLAQLKKLLK